MPYYRRVGDLPRKRHIRFERPEGGLHSEELIGAEGFSAESALLYHRRPPTAIVKAEAVEEPAAAAEVKANRPLLPRHLRTPALPVGGCYWATTTSGCWWRRRPPPLPVSSSATPPATSSSTSSRARPCSNRSTAGSRSARATTWRSPPR